MFDREMENCQLSCLNSPQLRTYNEINDFNSEKFHLKIFLNFRHKTVLSKFRMSTLPIRIVTGRWERPKLKSSERYCLQCLKHSIYDKFYLRANIDSLYHDVCETECHFALKCSRHASIRLKYFSNIDKSHFTYCNSDNNIIKMLCNHPDLVRSFAAYLTECYDNRL